MSSADACTTDVDGQGARRLPLPLVIVGAVIIGALLASSAPPPLVPEQVCVRHVNGRTVTILSGDDLAADGRVIGYGTGSPTQACPDRIVPR